MTLAEFYALLQRLPVEVQTVPMYADTTAGTPYAVAHYDLWPQPGYDPPATFALGLERPRFLSVPRFGPVAPWPLYVYDPRTLAARIQPFLSQYGAAIVITRGAGRGLSRR